MEIDGRPCRTEVAKVNRECSFEHHTAREHWTDFSQGSLYLSKVTGEPIPEAEAREIMGRFGALERVWFCTQTDKEMFRLPEGVWIMFAFFQDCRDAQAVGGRCVHLRAVAESYQGFRDHHLYRLEQPRMPDEVRARMFNRGFESPSSSQLGASPGNQRRPITSPQTNSRRTVDLNSIFVGNLPAYVDDQMLRSTFGAYGRIKNVEIMRKPSINRESSTLLCLDWYNTEPTTASGKNIFAFVEYHDHEEAAFATQQIVTMQGIRLRVEQKESIEQYNRRDMATMAGGSPRGRYLAESQDALAMLFQRGVSVGMANAMAAQNHALPAQNYGAAGFPCYPPYNQSHYGQYFNPLANPFESDPQSSLQMHGNLYAPNSLGQMQYPKAPQQYIQYPQYPQPAPRPTNYQWPPTNDSNTETGLPTVKTEEEA